MAPDTHSSQRDRYVSRLIARGSWIALPELRRRSLPEALYHRHDRHGVDVVAVRESSLDERQLQALSRFRFAQYVAAGFVDKDIAFARRLDRDAPVDSCADAVHVIASATQTGQLLASVWLIGPPNAEPGTRFGSSDRGAFQTEEHLGWGAFQRLARLPDTPVERVRELGRLVKNSRCGLETVGPRPLIEVALAMRLLLTGELARTVDVVIGEVENHGSRRNMEFFHTPLVVFKSGLPVLASGHPFAGMFEGRDKVPFAFHVSDLQSTWARVAAIEAALELPGRQGVQALVALNRVRSDTPSSLLPPGGLPALADTPLPQHSMSSDARRRAREHGRELRRFTPFAGLSETEATTLRTFAEELRVQPGDTVLKRGQVADGLLLIEDGRAAGGAAGPGECLGVAGVLAAAPAPASVVAQTPMRLLKVPADVYRTYLRELPEVEIELQRLAVAELRPSSRVATNTAEAMAALRALGAAASDPALRNPDHMAREFLTVQPRVHSLAKLPGVRRLLPALADRLAPGGLHYETARVKHIDAILRSELKEGLEQLVILGAGYDTRPYRFADALGGVRVYEVDLPPISAVKRRKAARVLGAAPENVTYIGSDFLGDDLLARLQEHGYDLGAPTLLILSGVAPYLPEPAVARLLAFAGAHASPRSSIAFDYVFSEMIDGDDAFRGAPEVRRRLAALGEPFRSGIPAGGARRFIAPFGLTLASDVHPGELAERYLRRSDGTAGGRPYGFTAIAHARVAA